MPEWTTIFYLSVKDSKEDFSTISISVSLSLFYKSSQLSTFNVSKHRCIFYYDLSFKVVFRTYDRSQLVCFAREVPGCLVPLISASVVPRGIDISLGPGWF